MTSTPSSESLTASRPNVTHSNVSQRAGTDPCTTSGSALFQCSAAGRSSHTHRTGPSRFFCCCSIHPELSTCWHSTVRKHSHFETPLENPSIQTHLVLLCCIKRLCIFGPKGAIIITYGVDHKKMSQIFCLTHRQNCFRMSAVCPYLTRQWRHSRRHWEILDEEGTLLKSVYQKVTFDLTRAAVPFEIPLLEKADVGVGVSWSGKTYVFFIDPQKIKVDQNC